MFLYEANVLESWDMDVHWTFEHHNIKQKTWTSSDEGAAATFE